jgi:hypothetical protein
MPTFPTYRGELPQCLNPLNLRHYFLLAYWVYFRPTALKGYLYQANPELYRTGPGLGIFHSLRAPAYRNLYLMMPGAMVLLSVLIGLPLTLATSWAQGTPVNWLGWTRGAAGGVGFGLAVGAAFGLAFGVASSVAGGVAFGVAGSLVGFLAFGAVSDIPGFIAFGMVWSIAFGVAVGVAGFVAGGVALSVGASMAAGVALGVALGAEGFVMGFVVASATFGAGALRSIFYPLQLVPALCGTLREGRHPLEWDELAILPLPGTRRALAQRLQVNEPDGLRLVAEVARNPFQCWAAQAALHFHLHVQSSPIQLLYALLANPDLDEYVFAPVFEEHWERLPNVRRLLLGELDRRWMNQNSDWANRLAERVVWAVTCLLRDRRRTPLTRFAGMLYELLDEAAIAADDFDLATYSEIYTGLADYPGGEEIAHSFEALAAFLSYDDLSALAATVGQVGNLSYNKAPIRPTVLAALARLAQVGTEVATYRDATSRVNQLAALARATDALDGLDEYVVAKVIAPEQYILRRVVRQWRRLVSEAGGEVGRVEEAGPVANPYVAGNPVTGDLFVGREDILRRLEELWSGEGQKPSVVLYGHRRMGKSSILHNLGTRFGPRTVIVDFNMQRVGLVESTGELLYNLALALYDAQMPRETRFFGKNLVSSDALEEPDEERFTEHNPYTAFDRLLKRLARSELARSELARSETGQSNEIGQSGAQRRFIVTVDEFELIEAMIAVGKLEPHLLTFWRGLIQTYPWFVMAFAGLHTLEEMTRDYWHPLYGSVVGIPVSFLSHAAARRLITQPRPEFPLDYDPDAVERIIALTHGQPYLTQLIGHGLVTRFNRQTFEERVERERRFSLADVEAVINAPEFYRDGDAYFTGVWRQAETSEPPGQAAVLRALADLPESSELSGRSRALETLARHDVVVDKDGRWQFTVELMRRWVAQKENRV